MKTVRQLLQAKQSGVYTIEPDAPVIAALHLMAEHGQCSARGRTLHRPRGHSRHRLPRGVRHSREPLPEHSMK